MVSRSAAALFSSQLQGPVGSCGRDTE